MQPSAGTHRPPDDPSRATKVEHLLQSQAGPEPDSATGSPAHDRMHPMYIADHHSHHHHNQLDSRRQSGERPLSPVYSRHSGPSSRPESQQASVPASPFAQRQPPMHGDAAPESAAVPAGQPGRPALPLPQPQQFSPPLRRARQHAATISDPLAIPSRSHPPPPGMAPPPPQHQQAGFRYYQPPHYSQQQQQQPPPQQQQQQPRTAASASFDTHPMHVAPDGRPRRLSFVGTPLATEPYRDHYEPSHSRSTSAAGPHYHPGNAQTSPHGPYFPAGGSSGPYAHRPPPPYHHPLHHPQQQQQYGHGMQPPASAPPHQQTFGRPPLGGPGSAYGPRPGLHGQRSLSPPPAVRRHLPLPGRFDSGGPQRSPLPFPRISSPSIQQQQQHQQPDPQSAMMTTPTSAAAAAAANATSSQSPARESTRRLSSVVWGPTGFERLDSGMSRCRICHKEYSKGSSTGTLKRHFRQHQENVSRSNPYARPGSPPPPPASAAAAASIAGTLHAGSRPRAYSHRVDSRPRREASPFASPLAHTPIASPMGAGGPESKHTHLVPPLEVDTSHRQDSLGDLDTNSVIAGSALLSMAAGDSGHMAIDGEAMRRPMRSSDPSVYPHTLGPDDSADIDPETCDISVSPSPSSTSSTEDMHRDAPHSMETDRAEPSPDDMDIEDDPPQKRRRATIAGAHEAAIAIGTGTGGGPVPGELGHEINSLSVAQLVALSSELVRRVASALPMLALEADQAAAAAAAGGGASERRSSDPLDLLFRHVNRALGSGNGIAGMNGATPATPGLSPPFPLDFPTGATPVPSCALPYTIRKQVLIGSHATRPITDTVGALTLSEMNLLARVSAAMQRIAPLTLAEREWDNVGILLEAAKPRADAKRVFLTIDLTAQTLSEALDDPEVGVIVAYHPPIFYGWKSLTMGNVKQSLVLKCAAAGVSIYSPHTSLDSCANGINDWLASLVGTSSSVAPIKAASAEDAKGQANAGSGRIVQLEPPRQLGDIVSDVKRQLGLARIRVARAECHGAAAAGEQKLVSTVAICAGSGAAVVGPAKADVYLTGEMGHHDLLAAVAKDTSCILAEHSNSERGYLRAVLAPRLQQELDADAADAPASIVVSDRDCDPVSIE
ncbi:hypothetical protein H4R19_000606 [Coemansia spiralis]|nr:hypothetical protein H4R19_000606 [Coemansia spiralis]